MSYVSGTTVDVNDDFIETHIFVYFRDTTALKIAGKLIGRGTSFGGEGGGPTEPYYANVSLLLRGGSGAAGSQAIASEGPTPKTMTATGDVSVSKDCMTLASSSSIRIDSGGFLSSPPHSDFSFGTGAFTIEGWIFLDSLPSPSNRAVIFDSRSSSGDAGVLVWVNEDGALCYGDGVGSIVGDANIGAVSPDWQWFYFYAARDGSGNVTLKLNGGTVASGSDTSDKTEQNCFIGADYAGVYASEFVGYLEDFRVTKGVARSAPAYQPDTNLSSDIPAVGHFKIDLGDDFSDGTCVQVVAYSDGNQWNDMIHITYTVS